MLAAEADRCLDIQPRPYSRPMGRITSNVDDEVVTRIDARATAEDLSRSEWVARAVIDRLAVEERGALVPPEDRVPRHEYEHAIQIRDLEIQHLKEDLGWARGELVNRGRQHELLITSIPQMLPPPKPAGFWDQVLPWRRAKKE